MKFKPKPIQLIAAVISFLLLIVLSKPIVAATTGGGPSSTWTQVINQASSGDIANPADLMNAFSHHLASLTSFYETVITILLTAIAFVSAFAFWTIGVVSRQKAEEIAKSEALSFLDSVAFSNAVRTAVDTEISSRMAEYDRLAESLQIIYERLDQSATGTGAEENENGNSEIGEAIQGSTTIQHS